MKRKILKLSETVINQIAAGEVVENPASIVKELIENSLDAGASQISIEIVGGGHQLIRIEDDGCGMSPEDAVLSLERHATSKIQSVEDLQSLSTMGFRGEALAAIASVSHFELKTSDGTGTRIVAEGGQIVCVEPVARNRGTTIEVRSLFYNVPARKKFQKSASATAAQVTRVVEVIALAHPEISFRLNGKEYAPTTLKNRIEEILGPHEHEVHSERVSGFVAAPSKAMSTRTGQYLFINRRPIFSPLIAKAVKEAFCTRIGEHAYPRFVLFMAIAPDTVDVNVHPQKKEVRFRDEGSMFRMVQQAVSQVFTPSISFPEAISFSSPPPPAFSFEETFSAPSFKLAEAELDLQFNDRILTVFGNYLLIEKEKLILVDLRAANARVLFESIQKEKATAQALMWPLEIEISRGDEERAESLNEIGVECRVLKKMLIVDALPSFIQEAQFPDFFESWMSGKKVDQIITRFCRSTKKTFSIDEAGLIWRRLQTCSDSLYDPLGQRIWSEVDENDLSHIIQGK